MPFRKRANLKGKHLAGTIILALALYLVPQICAASCPMAAPAMQKCCCDHSQSNSPSAQITGQKCCSLKAVPAKDKILLSFKSVETPVFSVAVIGTDSLIPSSIRHEVAELPIPLARLALQSPVLRI